MLIIFKKITIELDNDEEDEPWELRLSGGLTSMDGRVEIRRGSGNFGLICDVGWTINEGNVVCRELGYRLKHKYC